MSTPSDQFWKSGHDEVKAIFAWLRRAEITVGSRAAMDFGCGIGRLTRPLAQHFDSVIGVDISPQMVASARELHRDCSNCRFELNESDDLAGLASQSLDFVLSLIALQHIRDPRAIERLLAEFVRLLRPGGTAVVQIPGSVPLRVRAHPVRVAARVGGAPLLRRLPQLAAYSMAITALHPNRVREVVGAAGGEVQHVVADNRVGSDGISSFAYVIVASGSIATSRLGDSRRPGM